MANPVSAQLSNRPVSFGAVSRDGQTVPSLSAEHKVAILLTLVPAAPNNKKQLYKISVKPSEVQGRLPAAAAQGLQNALGPIKEVRVSAGFETARIRWVDDRSDDIKKLFGALDGEPNLTGLVVNDVESPLAQVAFPGGGGVAASLREIAKSIAASIYANETDRLMGSRTTPMNRNMRISGNLGEIIHEVGQNGVVTTTARLPDKLNPLPIVAFMDQGTRAIVFREVQSSKG